MGLTFRTLITREIDENGNPLGIVVTGPRKISKFGMYAYCWPGCLTVMYDSQYVGLIQIDDIKKIMTMPYGLRL